MTSETTKLINLVMVSPMGKIIRFIYYSPFPDYPNKKMGTVVPLKQLIYSNLGGLVVALRLWLNLEKGLESSCLTLLKR